MSDPKSPDDYASEILGPIINVFEGHDGGGAYATFRHSVLPSLIIVAIKDGEPQAIETLNTVRQFSLICQALLTMAPTSTEKQE